MLKKAMIFKGIFVGLLVCQCFMISCNQCYDMSYTIRAREECDSEQCSRMLGGFSERISAKILHINQWPSYMNKPDRSVLYFCRCSGCLPRD
ncbi:hypothetical protein GJ496_011459 [Pomphorhynchus laevis]|nr:hypothetical protein GJ496_011459 [Pomphorhynchus laevis]